MGQIEQQVAQSRKRMARYAKQHGAAFLALGVDLREAMLSDTLHIRRPVHGYPFGAVVDL